MDFNKLENIVRQKGYTMAKVLEDINLSAAAYYRGKKANSMKVETLEKIFQSIGATPAELYTEQTGITDTLQEPQRVYVKNTASQSLENRVKFPDPCYGWQIFLLSAGRWLR